MRKNVFARGEPARGQPFAIELAHVKRKFVSERLVDAGLDRATHWGWPNIYTYTKAIGEQVIARSGLPSRYVPGVLRVDRRVPTARVQRGCEYERDARLSHHEGGGAESSGRTFRWISFRPITSRQEILALAELSEGSAKPVYQFGASDVNPCTVQRFGELMGLYKRKHYRTKISGNVLFNAIQARYEPTFVDRARFHALGPPAIARASRGLASLVRKAAPGMRAAAGALERAANRERKVADVQEVFAPFTTTRMGPFDCSNTRAAYGRLSEDDKAKLRWAPESIRLGGLDDERPHAGDGKARHSGDGQAPEQGEEAAGRS